MGILNDILQFLYWPSLLMLVFGIVGNVILFMIYSRLNKLSVALYYQVGAVVDTYTILNWVKVFFREKYHFYLINVSTFMCKSIQFTIYASAPISNWLKVVVSIDRLINIVYGRSYLSFLSNLTFQIVVIVVVIGANLAFYSVFLVDMKLIGSQSVNNGTNLTTFSCKFESVSIDNLLYWLDIGNTVFSFVIMTIASIVTIVFIFNSRRQLKSLSNVQIRKSQIRDAKFAVTSISLNLFLLVTNLPLSTYKLMSTNLFPNINAELSTFLRMFFTFLWYLNPAVNVYIQIIVNSLVRAEFYRILGRHVSGSGDGKSETNNGKSKS